MDRLLPRMLEALSREQIAELFMRALASHPDFSADATAMADAAIAAARPTPAWAVDGVLLCLDLLPHIFHHLDLGDAAAASVCSDWRRQWSTTLSQKRILKAVVQTIQMPEGFQPAQLRLLPDGRACIALQSYHEPARGGCSIFDVSPSGDIGAELFRVGEFTRWPYGVAVTDDAVYVSDLGGGNDDKGIVIKYAFQSEHGGLEPQVELKLAARVTSIAIIDDLLFGLDDPEEEVLGEAGRVIALDKNTLAQSASFPLPWQGLAGDMCAHAGQLFIPCRSTHTIRVLSTTGEELRVISGEFRYPTALDIFDERIYLLASRLHDEVDVDDEEAFFPEVHVLTLDGVDTQPPFRISPDSGQSEVNSLSICAARNCVYLSDWMSSQVDAIAFA